MDGRDRVDEALCKGDMLAVQRGCGSLEAALGRVSSHHHEVPQGALVPGEEAVKDGGGEGCAQPATDEGGDLGGDRVVAKLDGGPV